MFAGFKDLSVTLFAGVAKNYTRTSLAASLKAANIRMLPVVWVSMGLLSILLVFGVSLVAVLLAGVLLDGTATLFFSILVPVVLAAATGAFFAFYPAQVASGIRRSIDANLPFALAQMSAVASSGIPPEHMFELLAEFREFGKITGEARQIVRNVNTFGMSSLMAITEVASRTPSARFKQVLQGITSTTEKGGNLAEFLRSMADKALFDYRIQREKYLKSLSTYADIYTAVLVAAPLILLSVLGILNIIGGDILGLGITEFIFLITWVIMPSMNLMFLLFIQFTYPST